MATVTEQMINIAPAAAQEGMTPDQMRHVFNLILGAWAAQRQRMTPEDIEMMAESYSIGLMDLDFDLAKAAVIRCMRTHTLLPPPSTIRAAAGIVKLGHGRLGAEAWGDVKKLQSYRDLDLTDAVDPLLLKVCDYMGWLKSRVLTRNGVNVQQWCVTTGENEAADRARFMDTYDQLAAAALVDAQAAEQLQPAQMIQALPRSIAPRPELEQAAPAPRLLNSAERHQGRLMLREALAGSSVVRQIVGDLPAVPERVEIVREGKR